MAVPQAQVAARQRGTRKEKAALLAWRARGSNRRNLRLVKTARSIVKRTREIGMGSSLYNTAKAKLARTPHEQALVGFETGLQRHRPRLLRNMQSGARLVGAGEPSDCREMVLFLEDLAGAFQAPIQNPKPKADEHFVMICEQHESKGLGIPRDRLPEVLWRFIESRGLLKRMLQAFCDAAKLNLYERPDSLEEVFSLLARKWSPQAVQRETLARSSRKSVFATFDPTPLGVPRDFPETASDIRAALALPPASGDALLYRLAYNTDRVQNHRFPTVADAGSNERFQPAPDAPPDAANPSTWWGWTAPDGNREGLPEIVHDNASLAVLDKAPQLCKNQAPEHENTTSR